ncbi:MAG TPA: hypothetical protein VGR58_05700 [Candidatus Acidoferrum sp.]|nr:hypothetical protein [Candidatus Acidoferrum sp.]
MKNLAQRLQQIPPSVSRAFRDYRYAFCRRLNKLLENKKKQIPRAKTALGMTGLGDLLHSVNATAAALFSVPAPVRIVNRPDTRAQTHRHQ